MGTDFSTYSHSTLRGPSVPSVTSAWIGDENLTNNILSIQFWPSFSIFPGRYTFPRLRDILPLWPSPLHPPQSPWAAPTCAHCTLPAHISSSSSSSPPLVTTHRASYLNTARFIPRCTIVWLSIQSISGRTPLTFLTTLCFNLLYPAVWHLACSVLSVAILISLCLHLD